VRYQVPQYLEVEDRIFGPFTLRQFLFAAGGLGGAYALWSLLPFPIGAILGLLVGAFGAALGFGKVNGRPFLVMIESMVAYGFAKKLYLWKKVPKPVSQAAEVAAQPASTVPRLSDSKLKELAWGLDINENLAAGSQIDIEPNPNSSQRVPTLPPGII
jgi:hypothetical protein